MRLRLAAFCAASLALTGCVATQRDVLDMEQQTDELKSQVADLKKTITSLQSNQADLAMKMDQLHTDVATFSEAAKDSDASMNKLSAKLDDVKSALDRKVSGMAEELTKQQTDLANKITEQTAAAQKAAEEAAKSAAQSASPSRVYHAAETAYREKKYAQAAKGFSDYLQRYPKGEMADLATYFLGEIHFRQKAWEDAARQYATVIDHYPKSDITPAARLKYAMCLINLKKHLAEAKRYLESIPEDFPKSSEAVAAKRLLRKLPATVSPK